MEKGGVEISINDLIDSHKGKIGIAMATGSSTKEYISIFEEISKNYKDKYCIFSVNEYDTMTNVDCDFRVVANSVFTIKTESTRFNNAKSTLLYANSVDVTNMETVKFLMKVSFLPYDQRHFDGSPCPNRRSCCENFSSSRPTIQEELQAYTKYKEHYSCGHTVTLHMIAFCILVGCKEIYISGFDLDYKKGYVDNKTINHDSWEKYIPDILSDLSIIKASADNIGINIYSTCQDSPINSVLEYKKFEHEPH